jgi:propanediol utilization protein
VPSDHRADSGAAAAAIRAAAAGKAPPRAAGGNAHARNRTTSRRRATAVGRAVTIGVSNRHLHLSAADARTLFGPDGLQPQRPLTQPGQFAAVQRVTVTGPAGKIEGIRVVGPVRDETQLEVARSDAETLGVTPLVAGSGHLDRSVGGVTLQGNHGRVELTRGVIVAARHLHLAPDDALRWGLADGDTLTIRCGEGSREVTWHGVRVRSGTAHATEFHLDGDEARAAGVESGAPATIVAVDHAGRGRRQLFTERDVIAAARRGETIPAEALLTPSARDRAQALGLRMP